MWYAVFTMSSVLSFYDLFIWEWGGRENKFLVTEDKGYLNKCLCGNYFIHFVYFWGNFLQKKENGIMRFLRLVIF